MFSHAILRLPGENFSDGLTSVGLGALGVPDLARALQQHEAYRQALKACGLALTVLDPDLDHPDSTFVEDTAVLVPGLAILTNPGAESRAGEVARIQATIMQHFPRMAQISAPGTLDGGDICEAGSHFFIGLSHRTNQEGAEQLAGLLEQEGYTASLVDIRALTTILHLKSGLAYVGENTLVVMEEIAHWPAFAGYRKIVVPPGETYAANCVRINDRVLIATGFPGLQASLTAHGFRPLPLDMSEYQKMDGGLSCLSLRF